MEIPSQILKLALDGQIDTIHSYRTRRFSKEEGGCRPLGFLRIGLRLSGFLLATIDGETYKLFDHVHVESSVHGRSELSKLVIALGEKDFNGVPDKSNGTIMEQLTAITPMLKQLLKQKEERTQEFADVQLQIQKLCGEISGNLKLIEDAGTPVVDESDLSLKRLEGFYSHLHELQREKSERLTKVLDLVSKVHDLCSVLGMDFFSTVSEVHPSLQESVGAQSKSITDDTILKLSKLVVILKEDKKQRLQKIQGLAAQLSDLWNLMDTPMEERNLFNHVTCNTSTPVDKVTGPGSLALDLIEQAEVEVGRLDQLKASKMKEIALKFFR